MSFSSLDTGAAPSLWAALPFVALLLAIAVLPMAGQRVARWWHRNSSKLLIAVGFALVTLGYYAFTGGREAVASTLRHAVLDEYVPFVVLIGSLYVISGGVKLDGTVRPTPLANTAVLLFGAVLANFVGTTGASVLLIRPLLQMNASRQHVTHTFVFFIFLVGNVGGCLTPVGDPPLFLGYLRGVPFTWTATNLWREAAFAVAALLAIYYVWDRCFAFPRETPFAGPREKQADSSSSKSLRLRGGANLLFLAAVVFVVATMRTGENWLGTGWRPFPLARECVLVGLAILSYVLTASGVRAANRFAFAPALEVACLFMGIFVTMRVPVDYLARHGSALGLVEPLHYYWATGLLSGFLDNAPTYAIFFDLAKATGGIDHALTPFAITPLSPTAGPLPDVMLDSSLVPLDGGRAGAIRVDQLAAISLGAVFFGALTYIGNGPNFIVRGIVESSGRKMPGFIGYMTYSAAILLPVLAAVGWVFLRS